MLFCCSRRNFCFLSSGYQVVSDNSVQHQNPVDCILLLKMVFIQNDADERYYFLKIKICEARIFY